jgi:Esterase-like activity of phytase
LVCFRLPIDAAIKKIYSINLGDYSMADGMVVEKTLVRDLMMDLLSFNGPVPEKIEGMTIDAAGNVWINNDNDGVDDNSGENLLINLGPLA